MALNDQVCVHQVIQKVNFWKYLWGLCAQEGL